ncbi:MAG: hypothetical protein AAGA92_14100 [Planctomycetota bacterium]
MAIVGGFVGVIFAWLVLGFLPWSYADRPGEFGDSFGFTNSLFPALAYGGVIATLLLQMRELRHQREEMARASKAQEKQAGLMFLSAFLSSASKLREITESDLFRARNGPAGHLHGQMNLTLAEVLLERTVRDLDDIVEDVLPSWKRLDRSTTFGATDWLISVAGPMINSLALMVKGLSEPLSRESSGWYEARRNEAERFIYLATELKNLARPLYEDSSFNPLVSRRLKHFIETHLDQAIVSAKQIADDCYAESQPGASAAAQLIDSYNTMIEAFAELVRIAERSIRQSIWSADFDPLTGTIFEAFGDVFGPSHQ